MELSVLQWNVWYKEDVDNIVEFLWQHPADIITTQELPVDHPSFRVKNSPGYIAKKLGYHYYHKQLPIEDPEGITRTLANGIFSKYPIKNSRFVWIQESSQGGGFNDEYRAYVEATLNIDGQELTIGTAHMSYTHAFGPTDAKKIETDKLVAEIKRYTEKYIFAGDLNALPDSYTVTEIEKLLENTGPDLDQKTWTTKPFSYNGFEANKLKYRLDHVFATKDIAPVSAEILKTNYSDHLPIMAHFKI